MATGVGGGVDGEEQEEDATELVFGKGECRQRLHVPLTEALSLGSVR